MPWMCLERCGDNSTMIEYELDQIATHLDVISGVSFEMFNLGPNSTLVMNNLTMVGPLLVNMGVETFPMVSSYPYPPQFIQWMRDLFQNPYPFMIDVIAACVEFGFSGVNLDFEPTVAGTAQDAEDYANFLTLFADELHKFNLKLTVDIAHWNTVWNWSLISESNVDYIFVMDTYTGNFTYFQKYFNQALDEIDIDKLGIGLETVNDDNNNQPFTMAELTERFQMIYSQPIQQIDIWDMPIPDEWWPFLLKFVQQ